MLKKVYLEMTKIGKITKEKLNAVMEQMNGMIVEFLTQSNIPGFSIAITSAEEVLYKANFGTKDMATNEPVESDTIMMIGSASKSYAAFALMQLVEQGKLSLDDPMVKHIPCHLGAKDNPITVKNLIEQSSGIPNLGMAELIISRIQGASKRTQPYSSWSDFYNHVNGATQEVVGEPNQQFIYSNTNFTLAAKVVEAISGVRYEEYVKENIFKPLEMTRTLFEKSDLDKFSNITAFYDRDGMERPMYFQPIIAGCGGIISTAPDQANYLQMMLNNGLFKGKKVISPESIKEITKMQNPHCRMITDNLGSGFGPEGYGYGWFVLDDFEGMKIVFHPGGVGIGAATNVFCPTLGIGISGVCNNAKEDVITMLALAIILALNGKNFMDTFTAFSLEAKMGRLTGKYQNYKGITKVEISMRSGLLWFASIDENANSAPVPMPMIPVHDNLETFEFYLYKGVGIKTKDKFEIDDNGAIHLYHDIYHLHKVKDL